MIYANNSFGERVAAAVAAKLPRAPYSCPICETAVRLRAGTQRVAHYAHVSKKNCDSFAHEMTPWHLGWQSLFPESEREFVLEADGVKHRTDVFHGGVVAIEFQHSPISETEFWRRCSFYTKAARHLVWVFDMRSRWKDGQFDNVGESGEERYFWHGHKPTFCRFKPKEQPNITLVLQFEGTDEGENVVLCEVTHADGEPPFSYFESFDSRLGGLPLPEWIDTILIPRIGVDNGSSSFDVPTVDENRNSPTGEPLSTESSVESSRSDVSASTEQQRSHPEYPADRCPGCGSKMVLRPGRKMHSYFTGKWTELPPFWGCVRYPDCLGKRSVKLQKCPRCNTEMFVQVRHRDNVAYWRCPQCDYSMDAVLKL